MIQIISPQQPKEKGKNTILSYGLTLSPINKQLEHSAFLLSWISHMIFNNQTQIVSHSASSIKLHRHTIQTIEITRFHINDIIHVKPIQNQPKLNQIHPERSFYKLVTYANYNLNWNNLNKNCLTWTDLNLNNLFVNSSKYQKHELEERYFLDHLWLITSVYMHKTQEP